MNKGDRIYFAEFAALVARNLPDMSGYTVGLVTERLRTFARRHHKLSEAYCNGCIDDGFARQERLEKKIAAYCAEVGLTCELQRDPRGCPLRVGFPGDNRTNPVPGWYD